MNRVAILYKGIFGLKRINTKGLKEQVFVDARENILDHKVKIFDQIKNLGYEIDFYMSTYNISDELNSIYNEELSPKAYIYLPNEYLKTHSTWQCQLMHYKNLILELEKQETLYDFLIFTRPDLKFYQDFNTINLNLDLSKFNIPVQHLSGNCDDNLFIFPSKFLNKFKEIINILILKNGITHEINHLLDDKLVPINWMSSYVYENDEFGHNIFSCFR